MKKRKPKKKKAKTSKKPVKKWFANISMKIIADIA